MKDNKKILEISIIAILISAIITIIITNKIEIDKPVFLKMYKEENLNKNEDIYYLGDGFFELKYISNIDDERVVTGITFKELPNVYFYASEYSTFNSGFYGESTINVERYGRYAVHTVSISCPNISKGESWKDVTLTEATVEFNDGLKLNVDIGKIILYEEKTTPIAIEGVSSSSSSDGTSSMSFKVKEDVVIEKIESPLFNDALEIFKFNVDSLGYNEIIETSYKKDSSLIVTSAYTHPKNIINQYTLYDIRPKIHFVNSYNDKYTMRYYNMRHDRFNFSYYGIYKYLKAVGGI